MRFNCQRCGRCCREIGIPWSELEYRRVADHLNMDIDVFLNAYGYIVYKDSGRIEPPDFGVAPCPFLKYDKDKSLCKIYPVRPWVCKGYPGPGIACRAGRKRPLLEHGEHPGRKIC